MRSIAWNMLSNLGVSLAAAVLACTAIKAMAQFVILPEVQVSSSEIVDFEFDYARDGVYCPSCNFGDGNSRFTFTDREYNLWLGYVDFQTGEFYPTNGHARLLDKRASFATDFGNGPEWMFSTRGSEIVYTKYSPGKPMNTLSASVAIASMIGGSWRAGIVDNGIRKQSGHRGVGAHYRRRCFQALGSGHPQGYLLRFSGTQRERRDLFTDLCVRHRLEQT